MSEDTTETDRGRKNRNFRINKKDKGFFICQTNEKVLK